MKLWQQELIGGIGALFFFGAVLMMLGFEWASSIDRAPDARATVEARQ